MRITIKTTGSVMLTSELRSLVEEKVGKLEKLLDQNDSTILAEVELGSVSQSRTGDSFRAEINLTFAGGFARAEALRETLRTALDATVDDVRGEVRRSRTKHRDLVRRGASKVKDFFRYFRGEG